MRSASKIAIIGVVLIAVAAIVVAAGVTGFLATTSTSSSFSLTTNNGRNTTSSAINPATEEQQQAVGTDFVNHLLNIESLNRTAIMADYGSNTNATVMWVWTAIGEDGVYEAAANISNFYTDFSSYTVFIYFTNLSYILNFNANVSYSINFNGYIKYSVSVNGSHYYDGRWEPAVAFVNSTFHLRWQPLSGPNETSTVNAKLVYVYNDNENYGYKWLIVSETWTGYTLIWRL